MTTLRSIRDTVITWIEDESINNEIDRSINQMIRYVTTTEFEALRRSVDITPDSSGVITCPPAYRFAIGIYPKTGVGELAASEFYPSAKRSRGDQPRTDRNLYHTYGSTMTNGSDGYILSGTQGSSTLSQGDGSTAIDVGIIGKELKLLGDNTRYLITGAVNGASMTVFPSLRAETSSILQGVVDPAGMRQYILTDSSGRSYIDEVTMDYQIDHPPLVSDDDELLIPLERTISLMTVQQFLQQSKYDVDAQRLENSIFEAKLAEFGTEPTNRQDSGPKDAMFAFRSKRGGWGRRR